MRRTAVLVPLGVAALALLAWMVMRDDPGPVAPPPRAAPVAEPEPESAPEVARARVRHEPEPEPEVADAPAPPVWDGPVATGRVIDADGAPVVGARITSHPDDVKGTLDAETVGTDGSRSFVGTSADDGTFEMPVDPDGVSLVLTATADAGFGQVAVTPKDLTTTITLVPWRSIVGRVTNQEDQPVAGATVRAHLLIDALVEMREAVSGKDGAYRVERLPPLGFGGALLPHVGTGRHGWMIAAADGYAPLLVPCEPKFSGSDRTEATVDLTLVRGLTLTGKIVDGDSKQPIAGATVVCWSVEGMMGFGGASGVSRSNPVGPRPLAETVSADDGSYRFENLPAKGPSGVASGNMGKRGMTMGHVAAWKDGYVYGGDEIPVSKDESTLEYDIELWPAATVEGRVVDSGGAPVEGVSVFASVEMRRPALNGFPEFWDDRPEPWTKTDGDGRYRLAGLRASRHTSTTGSVHASMRVAGSWVSAEGVEVTAMAGDTVTALDLVLPIGGVPRATFLVVDASSSPVAGASLGAGFDTGRTDKDGRYEWTSLRRATDGDPKPETLIVRADGFAPQSVEFTPARGDPVEVRVEMQPGARISGRVATADGRSVDGARVHVVNGALPLESAFRDGQMFFVPMNNRDGLVHYGTTTVDADGTFTVENLPEGPYHVSAELSSRAPTGPGRPPAVVRDVRSGVATGATDLLLTIPIDDAPETQPLEITVTVADGAPVETCTAMAVFGGPRIYAQPTSPGHLRFAALPAGQGRIEVSSPGLRTLVIEPVVIESDRAPEPMTVTLERGIVLHGSVRAAVGDLPDGAYVMASPHGGDGLTGMLSGEIAADGTYEISGLCPGQYRLHVTARHGRRNSTSLVPESGAQVTIRDAQRVARDLVVVPAGEVGLYVSDESFAPSPFVGGAATDAQTQRSRAARIEIVDAAGAAVVTITPVHKGIGLTATVAPGDHVVRLVVPGEPDREERATVTAEGRASVHFKGE